MSIAEEVAAIRTAVAVSRLDHLTVMRVGGTDSLALLDAVCPAALFLRERQMRHTLLLSPQARPLADVYVCCDEDAFILLVDGLPPAALRAYLDEHGTERSRARGVRFDDIATSHVVFGVDGPYAWELVAAVLGPEVNGMPYLSFLSLGDVLCFRAGRTGEFGYVLLVPRDHGAAYWARLLEVGAALGAQAVGLEALDQCALENRHFQPRLLDGAEPDAALTPLELQLQWRLSYDKDFVGAEALRERRRRGPRGRITSITAETQIAPRERVLYDGHDIGWILAATPSCTRGDIVGVAVLALSLAHPGIARFVAETPAGAVPLLTRTPPLVNNRSLYVDPHRHSGRQRDVDAFPPLYVA